MTAYLTPGVYFERATPPRTVSAQRTDVAGFVGLAERGPLHDPRRLTGWRQFQKVFGDFLPYANLAYSVRAFFENGGKTCYVVRVADVDAAATANADLPDSQGNNAYRIKAGNPGKWGNRLSVSAQAASLAATQHTYFEGLADGRLAVDSIAGYQAGSRVRLTQQGGPAEPVTTKVMSVDPVLRFLELRISLTVCGFDLSSGANAIGVESEDGLAATQHTYVEGLADGQLVVDSIAGFQTGSRVRLTQLGGPVATVTATVISADAVTGLLEFRMPLTACGFDLANGANAIGVESLEFTLLVEEDGQIVERFANLAPELEHENFAPGQVNGVSQFITMEAGGGDGLPRLPSRGIPLESGADGLRNLNIFDHTGSAPDQEVDSPPDKKIGLAALRNVDEVGLLSMPDLMPQPQEPLAPVRSPGGRVDKCALDAQTDRGVLEGTIIDAVTGLALGGARIEANDGLDIHEDFSNAEGKFELRDLFKGEIELLVTLVGYDNRIVKVASLDPVTVALDPTDQPPVFSDVDVHYGQEEMVRQCRELRDRFAIIDPPRGPGGGPLDVSGLQSWRARFDTPFAALYYPWLVVRDPLQLDAVLGREVPPSGHVAGVFAANDLAEGVWRPPANRALTFVEDVATQIDDVLHGVLNPMGVNAIRSFPGRGIRIYGARTMSSDSAWRFVNVRRLMSMLEEAFRDSLQWAVFEPNSTQLRLNLRMAITNLLDGLWRKGAFAGGSAEEAFSVRCDVTTTPPEVEALGRVIAEVGVAPTVPYEFIVLRLGLTADELQVSEV